MVAENQRTLIDLNSRIGIESRYEQFSFIFVHGFEGPPCTVTLGLVKDLPDPGMRVTEIKLELGYAPLLELNQPKELTIKLRPRHEFNTPHDDPQFENEVREWVEMFLSLDENLNSIQSLINKLGQIQQDPSSESSASPDESEEDIT